MGAPVEPGVGGDRAAPLTDDGVFFDEVDAPEADGLFLETADAPQANPDSDTSPEAPEVHTPNLTTPASPATDAPRIKNTSQPLPGAEASAQVEQVSPVHADTARVEPAEALPMDPVHPERLDTDRLPPAADGLLSAQEMAQLGQWARGVQMGSPAPPPAAARHFARKVKPPEPAQSRQNPPDPQRIRKESASRTHFDPQARADAFRAVDAGIDARVVEQITAQFADQETRRKRLDQAFRYTKRGVTPERMLGALAAQQAEANRNTPQADEPPRSKPNTDEPPRNAPQPESPVGINPQGVDTPDAPQGDEGQPALSDAIMDAIGQVAGDDKALAGEMTGAAKEAIASGEHTPDDVLSELQRLRDKMAQRDEAGQGQNGNDELKQWLMSEYLDALRESLRVN